MQIGEDDKNACEITNQGRGTVVDVAPINFIIKSKRYDKS